MNAPLSKKDQARVDKYLRSPVHLIERKPFRPLLLLGGIWVVLMLMSAVSYWVAKSHGVI